AGRERYRRIEFAAEARLVLEELHVIRGCSQQQSDTLVLELLPALCDCDRRAARHEDFDPFAHTPCEAPVHVVILEQVRRLDRGVVADLEPDELRVRMRAEDTRTDRRLRIAQ